MLSSRTCYHYYFYLHIYLLLPTNIRSVPIIICVLKMNKIVVYFLMFSFSFFSWKQHPVPYYIPNDPLQPSTTPITRPQTTTQPARIYRHGNTINMEFHQHNSVRIANLRQHGKYNTTRFVYIILLY